MTIKRILGIGAGLLLFCLLIVVSTDSSSGSAAEMRPDFGKAPRVVGGWNNPEELVVRSLEAFAARDTAALAAMLITEKEFAEILYPELGMHYSAARDQRAEARQFIWENHAGNSSKGLRKALRELGGEELRLAQLLLPRGGTAYRTYTIYEEPQITVLLKDGSTADMLALGSIVEIDGRYKLLSFRDRD